MLIFNHPHPSFLNVWLGKKEGRSDLEELEEGKENFHRRGSGLFPYLLDPFPPLWQGPGRAQDSEGDGCGAGLERVAHRHGALSFSRAFTIPSMIQSSHWTLRGLIQGLNDNQPNLWLSFQMNASHKFLRSFHNPTGNRREIKQWWRTGISTSLAH